MVGTSGFWQKTMPNSTARSEYSLSSSSHTTCLEVMAVRCMRNVVAYQKSESIVSALYSCLHWIKILPMFLIGGLNAIVGAWGMWGQIAPELWPRGGQSDDWWLRSGERPVRVIVLRLSAIERFNLAWRRWRARLESRMVLYSFHPSYRESWRFQNARNMQVMCEERCNIWVGYAVPS